MNRSIASMFFRAALPCCFIILSFVSYAFSEAVEKQLTANGGWCWFSGPSAIYDDGNIITGWVTNAGDIQVGSYRVDTGQVSVASIRPNFEPDDHDHPVFYITADGRITAFYSLHGGKNAYTQYCTTINPGGIDAWTDSRSLNTNTKGPFGATYANPYQYPGENDPNKILLFWRGGDYSPNFSIGAYDPKSVSWSWTEARDLINGHTTSLQRPYVKYCQNPDKTRIGMLFTDGHPGQFINNVYFAYLANDKSGRLAYFKPDGTKIKDFDSGPITPDQANVVFDKDAGGGPVDNAWVWDVAFDKSDNPVVVYTVFPDNVKNIHQYWRARWNGRKWVNRLLVDNSGGSIAEGGAKGNEPHYSGGITLDHAHPATVYLSLKNESGGWDLQQWKTADNGTSWTKSNIAGGSKSENIRPKVPAGLPDNMDAVLWMSGVYDHYLRKYHTAIRLRISTGGRPR